MAETYETEDLGVVVDATNFTGPLFSDAIPMRKAGWTSFAMDLDEEAAARVTVWARATPDGVFKDATSAFLDAAYLTAAGYYEVVIPTMAWEIKIGYDDISGTNRVLLRMMLGRSF